METLLKKANLKVTPQRLLLLDIVKQNGHIDIDSLYEELKNKFSSISLATIYKNINMMVANKLLNELKIPNRKNLYEITKDEHSHLVCSKCGLITDIDLDLDDVKLDSSYNFSPTSAKIVILGFCKNCK